MKTKIYVVKDGVVSINRHNNSIICSIGTKQNSDINRIKNKLIQTITSITKELDDYESHFPFDFKNNTQIGKNAEKRWYVDNNICTYESYLKDDTTSIIQGGQFTGYEVALFSFFNKKK